MSPSGRIIPSGELLARREIGLLAAVTGRPCEWVAPTNGLHSSPLVPEGLQMAGTGRAEAESKGPGQRCWQYTTLSLATASYLL